MRVTISDRCVAVVLAYDNVKAAEVERDAAQDRLDRVRMELVGIGGLTADSQFDAERTMIDELRRLVTAHPTPLEQLFAGMEVGAKLNKLGAEVAARDAWDRLNP